MAKVVQTVDLFAAVEADDVVAIRRAVAAGQLVNSRRVDGITPLVLAVSLKKAGSVRALLDLGADPELASADHHTPMDFARGVGDIPIEDMLLAVCGRHKAVVSDRDAIGPIVSGVARDLQNFLDEADLVLPPRCLDRFSDLMKEQIGEEATDKILKGLEATKYRLFFEQLFAPEALAVAHMSHGYKTVRSPMSIGMYDVSAAVRRNLDLAECYKGKFDITDALLTKLMPDELFARRPTHICEIGGAWGATIHYLTRRFQPELYHNYEPDRHFSEWAERRYGARKMPVDGETLQGTADASMDLVIANNVMVFVPPMKVWSYLVEMRRVLRSKGIILFNAVISDQISEEGLRHYIETSFPKRAIHVLPSDFIYKTFPESDFEVLPIYNKEYCRIKKRS